MAVDNGERFDAPKEGASEAQLKEQIDDIRSMAEVMGMPPDYSSVAAQLSGLSQNEREEIERYMAGEEPEEGSREKGAVNETPASPERRERRPLKRRFVAYTLDADQESGVFSVHESFDEWNTRKNAYERRTGQPTGIELPEHLQERLTNDPGLKPQVEAQCAAVRADLDNPHGEKGKGMALVYDKAENEEKDLHPKWYWYVAGQRYDGKEYADANGQPIVIGWNDLPKEIRELVVADPDYRKRKEYLKWLGPRVQGVRERIISAEIAKRFAVASASASRTGVERPPKDAAPRTPLVEPTPKTAAEQPTMGVLRGDPDVITQYRSEIAETKKMCDTVGIALDPGTWDSDPAFMALPDATRQALFSEVGVTNATEPGTDNAEASAPAQRAEQDKTAAPEVRSDNAERPNAPEAVQPALTRNEILSDAQPIMEFLREQYLPAMEEGGEALLEERARSGAERLLTDLYRKRGREVPDGMIAGALGKAGNTKSRKAGKPESRKAGNMKSRRAGETNAAERKPADGPVTFEQRFRSAFENGLRAASTRQDRALAVLDLLRVARSGDPTVSQPAQEVLAGIQEGTFGGEGHDAFAHAVFLDIHEALPPSRTVPEGKGARVALDDRYGLDDAVRDVVRDALERLPTEKRVASHETFVERSAARIAQHARRGDIVHLSLDPKNETLRIADVDRFGDELRSVYERLIADR